MGRQRQEGLHQGADQRQGGTSSIGELCRAFRRHPREETGHALSAERCQGSLVLFR